MTKTKRPQRARKSIQNPTPSPATLPEEEAEKKAAAHENEANSGRDLTELGYEEDFVRKPFGKQAQKLDFSQRAGFHRHHFRDDPGRIESALAAGYKHVKDRNGKPVSRIAGTRESGGPITLFLMEIPQEWYEADMAAQMEPLEEFDRAISAGHDGHTKPGQDGSFVPQEFSPSQTPLWTPTSHASERGNKGD